jgi:methyl-accepting chemotaxis protein
MKTPPESYQRNHYFIKKKFQTEIILKFTLLLLAALLLSTALLFFFSKDSLTSIYAGSRLEIKSTAAAMLPAIVLTNLITLVIVCFFSALVMLFISHRIAGPLFRFEQDIQRIADGDLCVNIHLRRHDQLKEMAQALNLLVGSLHGKISRVDKMLEAVQDSVQEPLVADQILQVRSRIQSAFILGR